MPWKLKNSGTKVYISVAPKYPLESVRIMDHRGLKDPKHQNVNICRWYSFVQKVKSVIFYV